MIREMLDKYCEWMNEGGDGIHVTHNLETVTIVSLADQPGSEVCYVRVLGSHGSYNCPYNFTMLEFNTEDALVELTGICDAGSKLHKLFVEVDGECSELMS